ncbi:MAG TPA: hypothetical protein VFZ68_10245 [Acidimicrobiales bacterium]
MAIKRVTISLPEELAGRLRAEAGDRPVSAHVADLIARHLEERDLDELWRSYLDEIDLSPDDVAAADRLLDELLTEPTSGAA